MLKMRNKKFCVIVLIAVGFLVYASNLQNPLFWDDDDWIKGNVFVHDFSHLKEIFTRDILSGFGLNSNYYRPLLLLSFTVNYAIGGIKPLGYHLVSTGFHIVNTILLFLILLSIFKRQLPAFLAAFLFLIHPLQTEAVTYISGRGDPMSVFFMLLALWLFLKSEISSSLRGSTPKHWVWMAGSLLSLILAILSRETAVLFPLLLMIFYVSFLSAEKFWKSIKRAFIKAIPYFAISVMYGILRLTVFNFKNTLNFYSQANDYTRHLSYRLYTFGHALVEYFKLIFAPIGLHMERDLPLKTSLFQWPVWLAVVILATIVFISIFLFRKSKYLTPNTHNPTPFHLWFFGWSWFFVALAPVSGIIPINAVMYEHWLYMPLIGSFTLVGFYLTKAFYFFKYKKPTTYYLLLITFLVVYFSFFAAQSIKRNILWGKPIEFYEDILKYNPNTVRIINNLGNLYSEKGDIDKAVEIYKRAVSVPGGNAFAQPYYNLGNIYRDQKNIEAAIEQYKKAIEIDPAFPFAYQNLAVIYANRGHLVDAAEMLEKVKNLRPSEPRVYYNLALIYVAQNKFSLAISNLEQGLKFSGNDPETEAAIKVLLTRLSRQLQSLIFGYRESA